MPESRAQIRGKAHWNNTVTNLPGSGLPVLPDRLGSPQVLKFLTIPLQSPPPQRVACLGMRKHL